MSLAKFSSFINPPTPALIFFVLFFLIGGFRRAYACNPCTVGQTYCDEDTDKLYECVSCSDHMTCAYDAGGEHGWIILHGLMCSSIGSVCLPEYGGACYGICDTTCLPSYYGGHGPQYWTEIGPCCTYSSGPTCGTTSIRYQDTSASVNCASGPIDIYVHNTQRAESVSFALWTDVDGQDDLRWYPASDQGGGVWKATADLENHMGTGLTHIHTYADNCAIDNATHCSTKTFTKVAKPDCPEYLGQNAVCGATVSQGHFSWGYNTGLWSLTPVGRFVLRVDHLSPLNPHGHQWMTINDFWKYVHPPRCDGTGAFPSFNPYCSGTPLDYSYVNSAPCIYAPWSAGLICAVTLNEDTICHNPTGGSCVGFKSGEYVGWSVQSVDECGNSSQQCQVRAAGFTCTNTAPYCSGVIIAEDEQFAGQTKALSARVTDTVDPTIYYTWSSDCAGTFSPASGEAARNALITTNWTPDYSVATGTTPTACTVTLSLADAPPTNPARLTGSCSETIYVRNPLLLGVLYDYDSVGACAADLSSIFDHWFGPIFDTAAQMHTTYQRVTPGSGEGTETVHSTLNFDFTFGHYFSDFPKFNDALLFTTLYPEDLSLPADTTLRSMCAETSYGTSDAMSPNYALGAVGDLAISDDLDIFLGYRLHSSLPVGWFASLGGSIYSGGELNMSVSAVPSYGSWFTSGDPFLTDRFAFGGNTLEVNSSNHSDVVSSRGYVKNLFSSPSGGLSFVYTPPSESLLNSLEEIASPGQFSSLDPNTIYRMSVTDMNTVLQSTGTGDPYVVLRTNYGDAFSSDGVVIIYLTSDDPSEQLVFTESFRSSSNRKLLLVTSNDVVFDPSVGTTASLSGDPTDAHVMVGIISGGDILFPTGHAALDPDASDYDSTADDGTLVLSGTLFAEGNVDFSRDRRLNNQHPAEAIHYDSTYLLEIQRQLLENPDFEDHFFSLVSISWETEE